jgi:membrane protein DedA with SNARE-associated domain
MNRLKFRDFLLFHFTAFFLGGGLAGMLIFLFASNLDERWLADTTVCLLVGVLFGGVFCKRNKALFAK